MRIAESGHVIERWDVGADPRHPGYRVLLPQPGVRARCATPPCTPWRTWSAAPATAATRVHGGRRRAVPWSWSTPSAPRPGYSGRAMTTATGARHPRRVARPPAPVPAAARARRGRAAAVDEVMDSGVLSQFVGRLGRGLRRRPAGARARARLGRALRRPPRGLDELRDLGAQCGRRRGRRRPRRRGDRLALHHVRVGGVRARPRRDPGLRRHRAGHVLPGPGLGARAHHAAHEGDRRRRHLRLPGRHGGADGDRPRARPGGDRGRRAGARREPRAVAPPARSATSASSASTTTRPSSAARAAWRSPTTTRWPSGWRWRATTARPSSATWAPTPADVLGFNYRMGELEAAIAEVQLGAPGRADRAADRARRAAPAALADLEGITPPAVPPDARHVYYVHASAWTRRCSACRAPRSPRRCRRRASR